MAATPSRGSTPCFHWRVAEPGSSCEGEPRTCHLHLVEEGGPLWRDYVGFRDYLRSDAEAARQFAALKRVLAARFTGDREAYMRAKSLGVQEILRLVNGAG